MDPIARKHDKIQVQACIDEVSVDEILPIFAYTIYVASFTPRCSRKRIV